MARECLRVLYESSAPDGPPRWMPGRYKGRAAEFGFADEYELAVELVKIAIGNRFHAENGKPDPMSASSPERAVMDRIAQAKKQPMDYGGVAYLAMDEGAAKELALDSVSDPVAWEACVHVVSESLEAGLEIPFYLRAWAAQALRGEIKKVDGRRNIGAWLAPRDDAIRFAIRMALESGAFRGATHNPSTKRPGLEIEGGRARSACELVAWELTHAGVGIARGYKQVVEIWEARNRENEPPES